eukprot:UN01554
MLPYSPASCMYIVCTISPIISRFLITFNKTTFINIYCTTTDPHVTMMNNRNTLTFNTHRTNT